MIAARPFADLLRASDRNALDLPVAALAGVSVAFVAFAMPADLLGQLVGATGIAAIVPAAQPPLGLTARIAVGVGGALGVFIGAFLLLRWLDRFAARAPARSVHAEEAPRLRKRDLHPDAPPCRPLSATVELGEPEPKAKPAVVERAEPVMPPPAPEPVPAPVAPPAAEPAPVLQSEAESLDVLMARLEQGLARRRAPEPATPAVSPTAPQVFPEPNDDRLQSAIQSLQRLAAKQH